MKMWEEYMANYSGKRNFTKKLNYWVTTVVGIVLWGNKLNEMAIPFLQQRNVFLGMKLIFLMILSKWFSLHPDAVG